MSAKVKLRVYNAVVIPTLLYGCGSWALKKSHLKRLEVFQMRCLRSIFRISRREKLRNTSIRRRGSQLRVETIVRSARLRWLGHVIRMSLGRDPKRICFSKPPDGKRKRGGQHRRWSDLVKKEMAFMCGEDESWLTMARDRQTWADRCGAFALQQNRALELRDDRRRAERSRKVPDTPCDVCGKLCRGTRGLAVHKRVHERELAV